VDLEKVVSYAKHSRTELAKEALAPEDDPLPPMIVFGREGKTLASVFCKRVDRDDALEVANVGIRGWACDEVMMVFDAHIRTNLSKDGELPERGVMQHECEATCGQHAEGVYDCLMLTHATKKRGVVGFRTYPYSVDYDLGEITWLDEMFPPDAGNDVGYQGVIPEALKTIFEQDPLADSMDWENLADSDDPVSYAVGRLIAQTVDPNKASREFLDEVIASMLDKRCPCTVVMARENKEPL
jgi:hypothetical protein